MKRLFLSLAITGFTMVVVAQKEQNPGMNELKEKVIPWDRMMAPNGNAPGKSTTVQGRRYSAYQIGLIDLFTDWIKKSYVPIGGLPQPERLALPDSRENTLYQPRGTGVAMALWVPCYDATGKKIIKAQPASRSYITILTNHLKGLDEAFDWNTPAQYYFTMYYTPRGKLVKEADEKIAAPYVNEIRAKIGDHFVYFTGNRVNVLLMPGHELPVVSVSIGEVLDQATGAIQRVYPDPASPVRKEVEANIRRYREKYRSRLQEPAFIYRSQLTVNIFSGEKDPFEPLVNDPKLIFPVYRFKPEIYELAKLDKPQWVHISFPYATEKSATVDWEIFKAMTTNFNYRYVYDYFFNPDLVKGNPYQPLKPVTQADAEATINNRENNSGKTKTFPAGIHFMDDFSDARSGTMPAGWSSRQKNRSYLVETPPGETGNWLYLDSGADLLLSSLKKPMPANFTLEFDLACTDYTNRSGRTVTVTLGGPGVTASLSVSPGNEQNIRIYPSQAYFRVSLQNSSPGSHNIEFASYSNKKTKVHVKIVRSGTSIIAYVNGIKVESDPKYRQDYNKEMALGSNSVFDKLEWTTDTVSQNPPEDKGKVFISNIRISRD